MEYPEITQAEQHKHLKNIKKNKATGPDDVKLDSKENYTEH